MGRDANAAPQYARVRRNALAGRLRCRGRGHTLLSWVVSTDADAATGELLHSYGDAEQINLDTLRFPGKGGEA